MYTSKGKEYTRDTRYIQTRITAVVKPSEDAVAVEPGRFRLVAARACPWANRTIIVRRLLGLEDVLSMAIAAVMRSAPPRRRLRNGRRGQHREQH